MLKKCTFRFLFTLLAMAGMSAAATMTPVTPSKDGNCYLIGTAAELYGFAAIVNGTDGHTAEPAACGVLTADIVVNEHVLDNGQGTQCVGSTGSYNKCGDYYKSLYTWTPIGVYDTKPFTGTFDGQGHTISGLFDNNTSVYTGLFGYVSGTNATVSIKNVGVEDSYFRVDSHAGGIVGMVYNGSGELNIENVYSASTFYIKGKGPVGGLLGRVGENWTLNITNAYNSGSIFGTSGTTTANYVAGLVGYISGSASVNIKNAFNYGNLNGYAPLVNSYASVQNSYYLGDAAQGNYGVNKSASDFSNGAVLALLQQGENGSVWQSGSPYPTLLIKSHSATLHYSSTESKTIYFVEGSTASLPIVDKSGNPVLGWYDNEGLTGTKYTEIPASANSDLSLYPKVVELVDGCFEISDADMLYAFAAAVNNGIAIACGKLTANIVVNQNVLGANNANVNVDGSYNNAQAASTFRVWTPIGDSYNRPFNGTFDGQGHTISGLYFNDPSSSDVGLFSSVFGDPKPVTIENVGLVDSYFRGNGSVGGLVGNAKGLVTIKNSFNAGSINAQGEIFGGLVGYSWKSSADVVKLTISNSYNTGSLNGGSYGGGLVGSAVDLIISNSYNTGSVTVSKTNLENGDVNCVGGFAASADKVTITNSYNYGSVSSPDGARKDDFVTSFDDGSTVTNSFFISECDFEGNGATKMSSTQFSDGTVFAALRSAEDGEVWRQYSGDSYPTFAEKNGTDAPSPMHVAVLHYSATDSVAIAYMAGTAFTLPTTLPDGSIVVGDWYKSNSLSGDTYTQIAATENGDLAFYAKAMKLGSDGYYEIATADDLYAFASAVNNNNASFAKAKAKLMNDIVVNQNVLGANNANVNADGSYNNAQAASAFRVWTPIGNSTNKFQGTFNGKGHTISGLYFNNSSADNVGLFGYTFGAVTIDSVGVVDSYFRGKNYVGSLVGFTMNAGNLSLKNSYNTGSVNGNQYVGGLVGGNVSSQSFNLMNSYNTGSVNGNQYVGGLVGKGGEIKFSYNIGPVNGSAYAGGLAGSGNSITDSYNTGLVKNGEALGNAMIGYGCDQANVSSKISNSYYLEGSGNSCGPNAFSGTTGEFANGLIAIKLHQFVTNIGDGSVWGQIVGTDKTPLLTGEIVFPIALDNSDNCYEISNADDLYIFAAIVNSGFKSDACGKLTENIVVNENVLTSAGELNTAPVGGFKEWTPIGNWDNPFQGTFHGQGHTISGLYFNDTETEDVGLFGDVYGTVVIDSVGLVDSYINAGGWVGGLVGYARGSLTISNSYNASSVTSFDTFGGLVGAANGVDDETSGILTISNSYNIGSLNGRGFGGGLVGYADALVVSNSYNAGAIYIYNSEDGAHVGGIASKVNDASTVTNSFNYGAISYPTGISVSKDDLVAIGDEGIVTVVTVTNSFTIGTSRFEDDGATVKSATDFSNGTVYAALHSAEDGEVWRQYKNDAYPTFAAKTGTGAPSPMHVAVLHYSETDSVVMIYTEGTALTLPTEDKAGNPIAGWTTSADGSGNVITEIPTSATGDLKLYPKLFAPNAEGFYEIATADDLYKFAEIVNNGTVPDAKAKLVADIVVNEHVLADANGVSKVDSDGTYIGDASNFREWTPIGNSTNKFQGAFDGQGHTISGLYVNEPQACSGGCPNSVNIGLFGAVENATDDGTVFIRNVGVEDSYFAGNSHIGGIVGDFNSKGNLNIENSYSVATIYAAGQSGGLAGYIQNTNVKIEDSYSYGNFKCSSNCGALVGPLYSATANVVNSFYLEGVSENWSGNFGTAASSDAFDNGAVATLLHGNGADADSLWGQNVTGGESHPTFFKGINVEVGPGVIYNGSFSSITVTLHYSEDATDTSKFEHIVGIFEKLPLTDKNGNFVLGWYKNASFEDEKYAEVPYTETADLDFYAKIMKVVDGCYQIADAEMLFEFAAIVNGGESSACGKLTADIEVNKNVLATAGGVSNVNTTTGAYTGDTTGLREWTPIGYCDEDLNCLPFTGIFDGQGHTISGLYFNDGASYSVGLFGYIAGNGATVSISNVGVEDSYFKANADVGGIVGGVYDGNVTLNIENVYNAATVVVDENGYGDVGGIVGEVYNGPTLNVTNAYNVGTIIGDMVGGLIGDASNDPSATSVTVNNSYNYGSVACSYDGCDQGALVGFVADADVSVTNSYYLASEEVGDYGDFKSVDEFADGTVYAALHSGENGDVWFLKPGDKFPTLSMDKNGPAVYKVTLNYPKAGSTSEYDPETISYVEGFAKSLPTMDKNGNPILGWYTTGSESSPITEISTSTTGAMTLFPKMYEPVNGCYEIATADQLYLFAAVVNGGNSTACGKLTANIVVNGNVLGTGNANVDANGNYIGSATGLREWTPIGSSSSNPFAGIFDGQGHSISGLYFNDASANDVGLFGVVAASAIDTIRNVGVVDSYFKGGDNVGAVTGRIACTSTCSVAIEASFNESVVVGNDNVGGIIGDVNGGANTHFFLSNAYNVGTVIGSGDFGGLVGSAEAGVYGSVANVFNYGTVSNGGGNIVGALDVSSHVGIDFSYYLGNGDGANSATEFADGTVLAELQKHGGVYIWKQGEKYPVFGSYEPVNGCYEIANASQLYWFAAIVNNGNTNACGKLVADIEVNENVLGIGNANVNADGAYIGADSASFSKWTPIGNSSNPFTGSFDGQGHTISGLYFNGENVYDVGLFGRVAGDDDGASVTNVNVADSYFGDKGDDGNHVGGVVGMVTHGGDVDVMNVSSAAVVVGNDDVGGIVGYVLGTEGNLVLDITNAYHVGMVKGSDDVGGLVGDVTIDRAAHKVAINNSYNYGDVSFESGAPLIGEVVNNGSLATIDVENSYYLSAEKVDGDNAAMTAGEFADGTVLAALRSGEDGYVWVQAPGDKYPTIDINASKNADTVVLAWTTAADSTTLAAAGYTDGAVVVVKDGKKFYADGDVYEGILSAEQVAAIGTNKLYPISGVDLETVNGKLVAYLDGDSYETVLIPTDVVVDKVIYKRDVPKMTFSTIMLPFSVPVASVSKHSFYKLKRVAEDDPDYHYAVKVSAITKTVAANRPYIMIDSTGSKQIEFEVENEKLTLNTTTGTMEVSTTTTDGITWKTKGVYEYKEWLSGDPELGSVFVFAAKAQEGYRIGQFAKVGAGASIQPMRLYLQVERLTRNAPGRLSGNSFSSIAGMPESISVEIEDDDEFVEEEKPMVVKNITIVPKAPKSSNWFDVNGRALVQKPTAKGTYYHNGQKVIIK